MSSSRGREGFWVTRKLWRIGGQGIGVQEGCGEDVLVREYHLKVFLNSRELATLVCSPVDLEYLVLGFLFAEGHIGGKEDLGKVILDAEKGIALVETRKNGEGGGRAGARENAVASFSPGDLQVDADTVSHLAAQLQERSRVFRETGGTHSAGLAAGREIVVVHEDIGRYNALDKVVGRCLWENISMRDKIVVFSGRVPSKVVQKVARMGARILVAVSAPTDLGIELAEEAGITLIGFARNQRMNIYTHPQRIVFSNP